jgi:hypothetical protein
MTLLPEGLPPAVGVVLAFLTLFAGATGPLVAAFVRQVHTDRFRTVATFAAAMSVQHSLKAVVSQRAGVDLHLWAPLVNSSVTRSTRARVISRGDSVQHVSGRRAPACHVEIS